MSILNVLTDFPYAKRYYLIHSWLFLKECWWNLKAAWQRATKGHAWRDSAEMHEYLLNLIPSMLRDIADGISYPCSEEFPNHESWQKFCNDLAAKFESAQEENCYEKNEYNEQFLTAFDILYNKSPYITMTYTMTEEEAEEICRKYHARENEIDEERVRIVKEAFNTLVEYYFELWI